MKKILLMIVLIVIAITTMAQFRFLGTFTNDGKPNYLAENDVVTTATLNLIQMALPESKPVPIYNPQYIYSGYSSDILLKDSAEVWITFVDEGAGYKNVLGFYTYNLNNPLTKAPSDENITIIFPNVSKVGFGGSLVAGNKVKLGNFSPNTGIGFILIADGWKSGVVTNGNWKLYSNSNFNPGANPARKQHNALLADPENDRVILGFEDIRRDNVGCDNDFNDALFYITASPYKAIISENIAPIDTSFTAVSSGNDGGLESNGRLANKIATQMFKRQLNSTNKLSLKNYQKKIDNLNVDGFTGALKDYLPTTGLYGTEVAYVSTPADLISITNAKDIYALDYYLTSKRVNAALITHTQNSVYDHSKYICDRLNGSTLIDVRLMDLDEFKLINTTLKRANGEVEYALTFSAKISDSAFSIYSVWNIDQYPTGEYLNFQIWGSSIAQIYNTANNIIAKLKLQKTVTANNSATVLPKLFIKKGEYKSGKYFLTVINKTGVKEMNLQSNYRRTETDVLNNYNVTIPLMGKQEEAVEVNIGGIFDAGVSIAQNGVAQTDNLYLADGAWALDYDNSYSNNIEFKSFATQIVVPSSNLFQIERNILVSGLNKGSLNIVRSIKPGNSSANLSAYKNISFELEANQDIELIVVENTLLNWNKRKRYTIKSINSSKIYNIDLSQLIDEDGNKLNLSEVKSVVFSIKGDYRNFKKINISVKNLSFNNNASISQQNNLGVSAFPNPCTSFTTLNFKSTASEGLLSISDVAGKLVFAKNIKLENNSYNLNTQSFNKGVYIVSFNSSAGDKAITKLSVAK